MAADKRFFGPMLSSAAHRSAWAGDDFDRRMKLVRLYIEKVRKAWISNDEYIDLINTLRHQIKPDTQPRNIREPLNHLFSGYRDYADIDFHRPVPPPSEQYDALELYCSQEGYKFLFKLISETLRLDNASEGLLLTAVALVEFITIDLYNLRLSQIGDARYANFQGITYRGLRVDSRTIEQYRAIASNPDLSKRNFSIPVCPLSASTDVATMENFALGDSVLNSEQMHLIIHVHGIDPSLLNLYLDKYPASVVTSICAMPIARISAFGEKEVLLRGSFFQLLGLKTTTREGHVIHQVEVVTINANRDHGSEHAEDVGEKEKQRNMFRRIATASRYEVCASLAAKYSEDDAKMYKVLQQQILEEIRLSDGVEVPENADLAKARSGEIPVWLGGARPESYPRNYSLLRKEWQEAIASGNWSGANKVLRREYDWRQGDWYNLAPLIDDGSMVFDARTGYTALHELAIQGSPGMHDEVEYKAWEQLLQGATSPGVWKSLRTFDAYSKTAQELALECGQEAVAKRLAPNTKHPLSNALVGNLEAQLHQLISSRAAPLLEKHSFRMPQLSVLQEMDEPRMWIPIPHMYGGFLVALEGQTLNVTVFETVIGQVRPKETTVTLACTDL